MPTPNSFPTTAWSFIRQVQDPQQEEHLPALNRFIAAYWKPVFCFVRARGRPLHQAEDLTQEFFTRLLEREWLQRADPQRGRFRTFLLTILTRFLSDQGPGRAPRQRQFEDQLVSISGLLGDAERAYEPPAGQTPDTIFMKQWAAALVQHVLGRLREFYAADGRPHWYEVFAAVHFGGDRAEKVSQEEQGRRHGMTRDQVCYALEMVQKRFVAYLRGEVRDQVGSDEEVGDEVRELLALLGS